MLPLPLMSPETCAKPNHDSKFIQVRKKKHALQGTGYFNAEKTFFQLVKSQCHYDVNLFQYLQHFMKMTHQKNKSHSLFSQRCYRQKKIIFFEKSVLGAV